jgi:hypothetical protein
MTPQSAKAKGRRLVLALRDAILNTFPQLEPDDLIVPATSQPGCDLKLSPHARRLFPFAVECKNTERFEVWKAIAQAEANCGDGLTPLVVFGRNRSHTYVVLRLDQFLASLPPQCVDSAAPPSTADSTRS